MVTQLVTETTLKSILPVNLGHFNSVMWHPKSPSDREREKGENISPALKDSAVYVGHSGMFQINLVNYLPRAT